MAERLDVYRCECGMMLEVVRAGDCEPQCCGKAMTKLTANTTDGAHEKHVPVMEKQTDGLLVKVGSVPHPMLPEHYIEWIEVASEAGLMRRYLKPGDKPEAKFPACPCACGPFQLREHCNIHGLWAAPGQ